jgi:hypothetical protein
MPDSKHQMMIDIHRHQQQITFNVLDISESRLMWSQLMFSFSLYDQIDQALMYPLPT